MRNFFTKTLYQKRHMLLFWFIGITFITFVTVSVYSSFQSVNTDELFKSLPPAIQKIAGDAADQKNVDGYIRQQVFALRLPMLLIILSIALLVGLTAGDEQKGLLETQLSLPVSRTSLLLQKLAAGLVIISLASLGSLLGIAIGMGVQGQSFDLGKVLHYILNCLAVAVVYGLVAFTLAAVTGRRGLALGIGSGFAFLSYLVNSMAPSVAGLEALDKLTFFHYYQNHPFAFSNLAVLLGAIVLLLVVSLIGFTRRDVRSN
jgi:ABC-2 type transport system permease protein